MQLTSAVEKLETEISNLKNQQQQSVDASQVNSQLKQQQKDIEMLIQKVSNLQSLSTQSEERFALSSSLTDEQPQLSDQRCCGAAAVPRQPAASPADKNHHHVHRSAEPCSAYNLRFES
ncbi:hypothetical protein C0Q70_20538 [Pomacea canaliculata]|uniref:Uncharacterized protein n=1 Tax=Pomacea canaliculata TaxID=400727 RepID=A0A2T7NFU3_POMCA|nr:hypothetical protein C0Q70_20538 [Pomacea canaliculata]